MADLLYVAMECTGEFPSLYSSNKAYDNGLFGQIDVINTSTMIRFVELF